MYDQIITVLVRQPRGLVWIMSAVYASSNAFFREDLWSYMQRLGCCMSFPWLLLGDFNQVLSVTEKRGGCPTSMGNMVGLQTAMINCSLVDLGYSSSSFTWSNMRIGATNIKERLDWGLGNQAFLHKFLTTVVTHLPRTRSDHHPILIKEPPTDNSLRFDRPFKLLTSCFSHPSFEDLVRASWTIDRPAQTAMLHFQRAVQHWNKFTFSNIFERKQLCWARIDGVHRAIAARDSIYLMELEG